MQRNWVEFFPPIFFHKIWKKMELEFASLRNRRKVSIS